MGRRSIYADLDDLDDKVPLISQHGGRRFPWHRVFLAVGVSSFVISLLVVAYTGTHSVRNWECKCGVEECGSVWIVANTTPTNLPTTASPPVSLPQTHDMRSRALETTMLDDHPALFTKGGILELTQRRKFGSRSRYFSSTSKGGVCTTRAGQNM